MGCEFKKGDLYYAKYHPGDPKEKPIAIVSLIARTYADYRWTYKIVKILNQQLHDGLDMHDLSFHENDKVKGFITSVKPGDVYDATFEEGA